jgi:hypothetical protein
LNVESYSSLKYQENTVIAPAIFLSDPRLFRQLSNRSESSEVVNIGNRGETGMCAEISENDPRHHTANMRRMLTELIDHARRDSTKISDPKAQALFETSAEVLIGIRKSFEDYEQGSEVAWKKAS